MFKFISKKFTELIPVTNLQDLNPYLKSSLENLKIANLSKIQNEIYNTIQSPQHNMLLCDEYCGRKYGTMLGIMNRVLANPCNYVSPNDFYKIPRDVFNSHKNNIDYNNTKQWFKPHGVIVLCHKFDFLTHYYKIFRKLDYMNKLKVIRLGNSLQSVAPSVENNDDTDSEESSKEDMLDTIKLNLINSTDWKKIDILFTSPNMMDLVLNNKDSYDYFDINPEIVLIDDFDFILK
jgi:hypothetical protein